MSAHCDLTVYLTVRDSGDPAVIMALAHTFTGKALDSQMQGCRFKSLAKNRGIDDILLKTVDLVQTSVKFTGT